MSKQYEPGVWHEWSGGGNPVPGRRVEVQFGGDQHVGASQDWEWGWYSDGCAMSGDIIAFRLVSEAPEQPSTFVPTEGHRVAALRDKIAGIIVRKVLQEDYDDLVEGYLDEILLAADEIILLPAYAAVAHGYYDRLAATPPVEAVNAELLGALKGLVALHDSPTRPGDSYAAARAAISTATRNSGDEG